MSQIVVNIYSKNGITTDLTGVGAGKLIAERLPRIGVPGGMGFGGGEALCLAAGACFFNNLRREAISRGVELGIVDVEVTAVYNGDAPGAQALVIRPSIEAQVSRDIIEEMVHQALEISFVANTLSLGVPVQLLYE
jgi:organic hydroperoxide reductase OsmC/OhrA